MRKLIIKNEDVYTIGENKYFKFRCDGRQMRDINCNLEKNNAGVLRSIIYYCNLDIEGNEPKSELVEIILNSKCLTMEKKN